MTTTSPKCFLHFFELGAPLTGELPILPTACLLAADVWNTTFDLKELVSTLVPKGCRYFMTWGEAAEELHDKIDDILWELGWGHLGVLTAVHMREPTEDIAWFLINATLPGEKIRRCYVGYSKTLKEADELLNAVQATVIR
jgi:hypothetical protein